MIAPTEAQSSPMTPTSRRSPVCPEPGGLDEEWAMADRLSKQEEFLRQCPSPGASPPRNAPHPAPLTRTARGNRPPAQFPKRSSARHVELTGGRQAPGQCLKLAIQLQPIRQP
ncbi:hypothetical protein GCM10010519_62240 [Streptomyces lactacystinicus]